MSAHAAAPEGDRSQGRLAVRNAYEIREEISPNQ